MISRVVRQTVERVLITRELLLFPAFLAFSPLDQRRNYAKQRKRSKYVDPIAIKKTGSTKKMVEFYKDMTAKELSSAMDESFDDVLDVLTNIDKSALDRAVEDEPLDQETIMKTITAFNYKPKLAIRIVKGKEESEDIVPQDAAPESECVKRTPVVTIMGHVDHGKTTLLDSLRNSRIVDGEFGGITQHIGAFSVFLPSSKRSVTFLDTPGHAAFANMRSRGARVTDIVVLVVAADDGVKEQTEQSIKFAREAGVPIIVAINKCDKPTADPARAKRSLLQHDIVVEELGGDVQCVEISALQSKGIDALQEAILTQADLLNLQAPTKGLAEGHVLESSVKPGLGKVCTVLVSRGTLRKGKILVAGTAYTRVRTMTDEHGKEVNEALPGAPLRISGWKDSLPSPGDIVLEASDSNRAEKAIKWRKRIEMEEKAEKDWMETEGSRKADREKYLEMRQALLNRGQRFGSTLRHIAHKKEQLRKSEDDGHPKLKILLRTDVEGSLEAILEVISTYSSTRCNLQLVDFGVGPPTEKEIEMAETAGAMLYTFNVDTPSSIRRCASESGVEIRPFNVVYRLVDALKDDLSKALPEETERVLIGEGHVLKEFLISDRNRKKQPIAGVLVDWGDFQRNCVFRFSRGGEAYYEGSIESMKCNLEVVSSAKTNTEVGLALDDKKIRFKEDDTVEVFEEKQVKQTIDWFPPGF
ncbi:hypothetical protein PRIPAC_72683 [Pristionchus pacificus]|uniref:50S ribosome-binding GTPase n=1 Tax=Pristionchus pacificus TaxID=54126 RepID=A0A2A6CTA3_PRIPA|nr:hypothetical protein PRIPAC_72683 [Pristionchus pacificus]|eukprot:PDM81263.1 50S ribosome-binding GTPase [Pristionchus pacificus]